MKTDSHQGDDATSLVMNMLSQLETVRATDEAYFIRFEDANLDTAPRSEMLALMSSAPNDPMRFFILGKYSTRLMCESARGRSL